MIDIGNPAACRRFSAAAAASGVVVAENAISMSLGPAELPDSAGTGRFDLHFRIEGQ
ncbi:MAG: hypothetical protein ACRED3_03795 [Bradyrhizobium sp.]